MYMCRDVSCVVVKGCLLWTVHSLGKTLLVFVLLHIVLQGQTCLLLPVFLDFLLWIPVPYDEMDIFVSVCVCVCVCVCVLVLEGLVVFHRTSQLQLICHQWLGHRLGLLWCWMVCFGNELRSFCCFWSYTQVLHFRLLLTLRATSFLLMDSCPPVVDKMVIWIKVSHNK